MKFKMRLGLFWWMIAMMGGAVTASAAPYFYWNGSVSTNWHDAGNWTIDYRGSSATNQIPTIADVAFINDVPENLPVLSTAEEALTLRVAYSSGTTGVLHIVDGADLVVAANYDRVGNGGYGTVNQSGGTIELNRLQLGNGVGATGEWNLSGGTFSIKNSATLCGLSGASLGIGDQGTGLFKLSGGFVVTRGGIALGGTTGGRGTFLVQGAGSVQCGSNNSADSGFWYQNANSTLSATVDAENGFTLGQIILSDGTDDDPSVTFEAGSILSAGFSGADFSSGSRSWDLMIWPEGTTVVDQGLAFAATVNPEIWSFSITSTGLRLSYTDPGEDPINRYIGVSGGEWITDSNWSQGGYPVTSEIAYLDSTANLSVSVPNNLEAIRVGTIGTGRLQIGSQATLTANSSATGISMIGDGSGNQGTVQQEGGSVAINRLAIGSDSATGTYYIHSGELSITRESEGISLALAGSGTGSGTFRISSGTLDTRAGVSLGSVAGGVGKFEVVGSHPGKIAIGSIDTLDGSWTQHAGSILSVRIDKTTQGVTPILIDDVDDDGEGDVVFENGALLDVDFTAAFLNGGTFTVMEWDGDVIDNGLQFAPSVDTSIWSFEVDVANKRLTVTAAGNPISRNFVHPGTTHTRSDLERMRDMVAAGIEPYATSFEKLSSNSRAKHTYNVVGDPGNTSTDTGGMSGDGTAAYYNALMWNITGDERHAQKAVEIFNAWSNIKRNTASIPLSSGTAIWRMIDAAEIIKHTYDGWSQTDIDRFSDMLVYPGYSNTTVPTAAIASDDVTFYWNIYNGDPKRHGNQGIHAMRSMMAMAIFLDNEIMYDRALRYLMGVPARADDLPYPSGPSIADTQTGSNDYYDEFSRTGAGNIVPFYSFNEAVHNYIWPNGQCQESSRDQYHTVGGVHLITLMSEMAWSQGDDLYGHLDNRLLLGMEFSARYNLSYTDSFPDQPTPWEPSVESGEFIQRLDRSGRWFSKKINPYVAASTTWSRGDRNRNSVYESNLAHYRDRMGLPSEDYKWLERGLELIAKAQGVELEGSTTSDANYGGLTMHRVCPGDPIRGFVGDTPDFAMNLLPGTIEAENYDYFPLDGDGRTYHDLSIGNSGGAYRVDDMDVAAHADGYALTDLEAGEWISYTVYIPETRKYSIAVRYAATEESRIRFSFDGHDVTPDVILPSTGSSSNWISYTVAQNFTLTNSVQCMRVYVSGGRVELDSMTVSEFESGTIVPMAPTGLAASPLSESEVGLTWETTSGASQVNLKRSTISGGPYEVFAFGPFTTNYTDTGLLTGNNYYYVISALYNVTESANSSEVSARPSALIRPDDVVIGPLEISDDEISGQQLSITIAEAGLGHYYRVLSSDSLTEPNWLDVSGDVIGNGGELQIDVPIYAGKTHQFYKLEAWRQ